jgi:anti-sigma B factor antagonist
MAEFSVRPLNSGTGSIVLELAGDLDLAAAPTMFTAGLAALDDPNCSTLTLNVEGVTFIDSTGIGSWIELRNRAAERGQRVRLRSVPPNIFRILDMGGLSGLFGLDEVPDVTEQA